MQSVNHRSFLHFTVMYAPHRRRKQSTVYADNCFSGFRIIYSDLHQCSSF